MDTLRTRCCIAGGGPAGMMLGYLLARAGIDVVVLEKHADFLRDFRGDTVHPSTLEIMGELGVLDGFLQRPHQKVYEIGGMIAGNRVQIADFRRLRTRCRFIALVPQWHFLNFLVEEGRRYPGFHVIMRGEVTGLIEESGRIAGVHVRTPDGAIDVRADVVVGADGRHSTIRGAAGLPVRDIGAPIDVLWMKLTKHSGDPTSTLGYFDRGRALVTIDRGEYWQCAMVIPKGGFAAYRARGIGGLHHDIVALAPFLADRVAELRDWDDVSLLTVTIDRLLRWHRPGLVCIGDAAHAMSPMGGVGINLAVQDAVAAANVLAGPLRAGRAPGELALAALQRRRTLPVKVVQRFQVLAQNTIFRDKIDISPIEPRTAPGPLPFPLRLLRRFPALRGLPAWFIGIGVRPEHVRTPDAGASLTRSA